MSRFNDHHRKFIVDLLIENHRRHGYKGSQIKIVAPYMAQVVRIRQTLYKAGRDGLLPASDLPIVATIDAMQGKESDLIILDWVVSQSDSNKDLGFTVNDSRGNVAMTRMREAMMILLPEAVGRGAKSQGKPMHYTHYGDRVEAKAPYPSELVRFVFDKLMLLFVDNPLPPSELHSVADENDTWNPEDAVDEAEGNNTGGGWSAESSEQTEWRGGLW
ncbi:uncharacterized protein APUU_60399A [Aspergillus puulaauensis]|uniref:DNA2/NAM7 helicase-like C-terminal domain-containing protein n=1 Tax=Aspergillus puulaauensis TaxID=1220207 RepID=A0A7R7XTL7_9EURO|nr:uncharacterized protein APUU_60399A [Aspergillus puulaauensis]BCS27351.1 hypothetical protein APUU_60399A [Aspergillus puulaauensis]